MALATFRVKAASENPTKTVVKARGFEIIVDEPKNLQGTDHGPNPVEYVLAALAGCLNVVGHVVAQEMNFTLRGLTLELSGSLDPAKFMGQDTPSRAGYQSIEVKIKPDCEASPEQLKLWLETIEKRCPVSDNISNTTPVTINLG